jgi:hypothetical protein
MADDGSGTPKVKVSANSPAHASFWFVGWLFTIGYVKLHFWPGVFALIIWPYYLGQHIRLITL